MLTVRLLGSPAIERDGQPLRSPRGRKAWALLSYVLLAERPPSRRYLAERLFGDADDPLGALRWTLAELRRALGNSLALRGDPVVAALEPDAVVDIYLVTREYADTSPLLDIAGELLDGMDLSSSPAFESWLLVERHRSFGPARGPPPAGGSRAAGHRSRGRGHRVRRTCGGPQPPGRRQSRVAGEKPGHDG